MEQVCGCHASHSNLLTQANYIVYLKFCSAKKYLRRVSVALLVSDRASYTCMRLQWPSKRVEDLVSCHGTRLWKINSET